jgi:hypothetical protein
LRITRREPYNKPLPPRGSTWVEVEPTEPFVPRPRFLNLPYEIPSSRDLLPVDLRAIHPSYAGNSGTRVRLSTPTTPLDGQLAIPTPPGQVLRQVKVRNEQGTELIEGKDFTLQTSRNDETYWIAPRGEQARSRLVFEAQFAPAGNPAHPPRELTHLDPTRLRALTAQLHEAGFESLAGALRVLIDEKVARAQGISTRDLETTFILTSLYSTSPERQPSAADRALEAKSGNPFARFAKFLDGGIFCAQCDGSNELFAQFLENYFADNPRVKVQRLSGFSVPPDGQVTAADRHASTGIRVDGMQAETLDTTASSLDPRNPLSEPRDQSRAPGRPTWLTRVIQFFRRSPTQAAGKPSPRDQLAQANVDPRKQQAAVDRIQAWREAVHQARAATLKIGKLRGVRVRGPRGRVGQLPAAVQLASLAKEWVDNPDVSLEHLARRLERIEPRLEPLILRDDAHFLRVLSEQAEALGGKVERDARRVARGRKRGVDTFIEPEVSNAQEDLAQVLYRAREFNAEEVNLFRAARSAPQNPNCLGKAAAALAE